MAKGSWGTLETVIVVVLFTIAFGWTLGPVIWEGWRNSRLLERGVAATARIVEVIDTGDRMNRNPVVRVRLLVQAADGTEFSGEVKNLVASAVRLQTLRPGATVAVRYDADNRQRMVIDDRVATPPP